MTQRNSWRWVTLVIGAALIVGVLTWLVVGQLVRRDIAFGGLVFTFLVMAAATLADWFTRDGKGKSKTWKQRLNNPNWLARIGMSAFFGLGAGLFVQQFIQPTEFDLIRRAIERLQTGQDEVNRKIDITIRQTAPKPWRAFENIDGYWGEEQYNCTVIYRFERRDHALTITLVRKEPDMSDYRMTASIIQGGQGDVLNATLRQSTAPRDKYGDALVFSYFDDGAIRRLGWLNERYPNTDTKLEWCGGLR